MNFNFEKNLSHQDSAVTSTLAVFENIAPHPVLDVARHCINPVYNKIEKIGNNFENVINPFGIYAKNIRKKQEDKSHSYHPAVFNPQKFSNESFLFYKKIELGKEKY